MGAGEGSLNMDSIGKGCWLSFLNILGNKLEKNPIFIVELDFLMKEFVSIYIERENLFCSEMKWEENEIMCRNEKRN